LLFPAQTINLTSRTSGHCRAAKHLAFPYPISAEPALYPRNEVNFMHSSSHREGDSFPVPPNASDSAIFCAGCRRQIMLNEKALLLLPLFFCQACASFPTEAIERYGSTTPALFPIRLLLKAAQVFASPERLSTAISTDDLTLTSPFADPWNI
jgi:hypothetical protein